MKYTTVKDIIEWDVLNWSTILRIWQPIVSKLPPNAKILAAGERNGGLSLWLALCGYNVDCTDRIEPTHITKQIHEKYNISNSVAYKVVDIVNDELPQGMYDLVILKSVLGGVKENYTDVLSRSYDTRQKAINNIYKTLKPGGYLLSADNAKGSHLLQLLRKRKNKDKSWHYFTPEEIESLYNPFQSVQTSYFGIIPTLFQNRTLNKFIYFINKYLLQWVPPRMCYIAITSARKSD